MERLGLNKSIATLGLPFYGRSKWRMVWRTYEDLASEHPSLGTKGGGDEDLSGEYSFNGLDTIAGKARLAKTAGLQGGDDMGALGRIFTPGMGGACWVRLRGRCGRRVGRRERSGMSFECLRSLDIIYSRNGQKMQLQDDEQKVEPNRVYVRV